MKKLFSFLLNISFFLIVILLAVIIATSSLVKKINDSKIASDHTIKATVIKQTIPILAYSQGIVKKIHIRVGEKVRKNELLIEMNNPLLVGKIKALESHPDNISAQTEADVAKEEMKGFRIYSPVDGVVTNIVITEGSPVETLTKMMELYSNDRIQLLVYLTNEQYVAIQQLHELQAYSDRLNQNFIIEPDILQPSETANNLNEKQIGLFFTFKDSSEAESLLNNEDLQLQLTQSQNITKKPIDYLISFWISVTNAYTKRHEK